MIYGTNREKKKKKKKKKKKITVNKTAKISVHFVG